MRPDRITDPVLGELNWNHKLIYWEGTCTFLDGTVVPLCVNSLGYETQRPPFNDATWDRTITQQSRDALARVRAGHATVRGAVSQQCLALCRKWNEEQEIPDAEFQRRLVLESITLTPDGRAKVSFGDDGMLAGHALIAHLDPDGNVRNVEMFG